MARISLAVCLVLLVTLSDVYETQAQAPGTFRLLDYLSNFPKMSKDFVPYASKGMLGFIGSLEGKSPATAEFKDFFAKLKDFTSECFNPVASPGLKGKSDQLFLSMSKFKGAKGGVSFDSLRLIEALVSMEKISIEMKNSPSVEIKEALYFVLFDSMNEWATRIALFVKTLSEMNGKLIDLAQFDIRDIDPEYIAISKQVVNKPVPFSLPLYLGNFPKTGKDFEPYAYKGMSDFVSDLVVKCPASPEFKEFFAKLNDYMAAFKLVAPDSFSIEDVRITSPAMKLLFAASALDGTNVGTSDPWSLVDGLFTMGETLVKTKKSGANPITVEQKKELTWSLLNWARGVSSFVKTAAAKKGVTIDLSTFEKYYNSQVSSPSNGGNVPAAGASVNKN